MSKMGGRSGCFQCSVTGIGTTRRLYPFPSFSFNFRHQPQSLFFPKPLKLMSQPLTLSSAVVEEADDSTVAPPFFDHHRIDQKMVQNMVYDALVWSTLNCLLVGDKSVQRSGTVPGVGLVHLPLSLLPGPFPESHWKQGCELAPIFNELVDRVSLDGKFLQEALSRTKKADEFTSRLLDIHSKMLEINKKEEICLALSRSDYMIDEKTKSLLQIEMNTISTSFALIGCLMTGLHRSLLSQYGKFLGLDPKRVPANNAAHQAAEALAKAWSEYNNPRAAILVVVQVEERNMYEQHFVCAVLKEKYPFLIIYNYDT
ncbi:Glutathione synthetase [Spatholobus suberectus]|nr:Glutathione synthetase [Spatholobus suberectus]